MCSFDAVQQSAELMSEKECSHALEMGTEFLEKRKSEKSHKGNMCELK